MKRVIIKVLFLGMNSFLLANACLGQKTAQAEEKAVFYWIQQSSILIRHVEAGKGFSNLQPLKQVLKDVKVIGLG